MPEAKLKFDDREFFLGSGLVTIGRATDNSISFAGDSASRATTSRSSSTAKSFAHRPQQPTEAVNGAPVKGEYISPMAMKYCSAVLRTDP